MGTAKRERQKANRNAKLERIVKEEKQQKARRTGIRLAVILPLAIAAVVLIGWLAGRGGDDDEAQSTTPAPVDTLPAVTDTLPAVTDTVPAVDGSPSGPACPPADGSAEKSQAFTKAFDMCIDPAKTYTAVVETNLGSFTVALDAAKAPKTVNNFVLLSRYHYYENVICHRVVKDFMAQCGDPDGTGGGGPGYEFEDELPKAGEYKVGSLAMANAGPNTNGSQFFIITGPNGVGLPPSYSLFGQVTDGLDTTVTAIADTSDPSGSDGPPTSEVKILSVTITES